MEFAAFLESRKGTVDETLERILPRAEGAAGTVAAAMRYAVLGPGKRLRPVLALAAYEACGGADDDVVEPAAALELIHTYSLVHDDLPAMDDDDLRRGRPTLHRAFGEAEAILAGDALLTLAFELLAGPPGDAEAGARCADAVRTVARGAGAAGMVGGQMADLEAENRQVDDAGLGWIHSHKTGALFSVSAEIGAIHAAASPVTRTALADYGARIGLAFQVADDILDCTSSADVLGKTPGKDRRAGKATYPTLYGLEPSRLRARELVDRAVDAIRSVGLATPTLVAFADHAISRVR